MEVPRFWRLRGQLLRLEGSNCPGCKTPHFPPRRICPDCEYDSQSSQGKQVEAKTIYQSQKQAR